MNEYDSLDDTDTWEPRDNWDFDDPSPNEYDHFDDIDEWEDYDLSYWEDYDYWFDELEEDPPTSDCHRCKGTGWHKTHTCQTCLGAGYVDFYGRDFKTSNLMHR